MAKEFSIFISHSWSYSKDLENLRKLLKNRGYFNVNFLEPSKQMPINSNNAKYLKSVLKKRIVNANIVLGLAGVYATYSDWMIWELETAEYYDIPIIGIVPRGQKRISSEVRIRSIEDINWYTESIVSAIRKYAI
jgi:hypothetical protein